MNNKFKASNKKEDLTKVIKNGSLTANLEINKDQELNLTVILNESYNGLKFDSLIYSSVFKLNV